MSGIIQERMAKARTRTGWQGEDRLIWRQKLMETDWLFARWGKREKENEEASGTIVFKV